MMKKVKPVHKIHSIFLMQCVPIKLGLSGYFELSVVVLFRFCCLEKSEQIMVFYPENINV